MYGAFRKAEEPVSANANLQSSRGAAKLLSARPQRQCLRLGLPQERPECSARRLLNHVGPFQSFITG